MVHMLIVKTIDFAKPQLCKLNQAFLDIYFFQWAEGIWNYPR